ncbi:MAG TPA: hypothetical protein VIJ64_06935 [Candidatus Lustribacter sp.]
MQYGTLTLPRSAGVLYEGAKQYLSQDPAESRLFKRLEHARDGRQYHLTINHRNDDHFDPNDDTIAWDPYSALHTTRGGRQSPALGLGHEVDHAVENPRLADRLRSIPDERYDNAEERRVIVGSERHAARVLGESERFDHAGITYRVASPVMR